MNQYKESNLHYKKINSLIPGGVNSPVRSFHSVDMSPLYIDKAENAHIFDIDGNKYIDYILSWGANIIGHSNKIVIDSIYSSMKKGLNFGLSSKSEFELSELILNYMPDDYMIRFVNSGTEAAMTAIRIARAYSKKTKIIKFYGGYHGHLDYLLTQSGSGMMYNSVPQCPGIPQSVVNDTIILPFNNIKKLKECIHQYGNEIACIITEPILGNIGYIVPKNNFLKEIEKLCLKNNILFILDEIMTGFRVDIKSAYNIYKIHPDIILLGKVIGGGLPIGAISGKKDILNYLSPVGDVYQAGTFSGNPLTMKAGIATMKLIQSYDFSYLNKLSSFFITSVKELGIQYNVRIESNGMGGILGLFFLKKDTPKDVKIIDYHSILKWIDITLFKKFFKYMLKNGILLPPSPFESWFLSFAHTKENLKFTLSIIESFFIQNIKKQ